METSAGAPVGAQLWGDDFIRAEIEPDSTMHIKKTPQPGGILWKSEELGRTFMSCKVLLWCTKAVPKGYESNRNWDFQLMFSWTRAGLGLGWRFNLDLHRETFYLSLSGLSSVTVDVISGEQQDRQTQMSSWISQDMMIFGDLTSRLFTTQTQDDFATRETVELS